MLLWVRFFWVGCSSSILTHPVIYFKLCLQLVQCLFPAPHGVFLAPRQRVRPRRERQADLDRQNRHQRQHLPHLHRQWQRHELREAAQNAQVGTLSACPVPIPALLLALLTLLLFLTRNSLIAFGNSAFLKVLKVQVRVQSRQICDFCLIISFYPFSLPFMLWKLSVVPAGGDKENSDILFLLSS